jgi:dolichol-phosphate mannosyltransferase
MLQVDHPLEGMARQFWAKSTSPLCGEYSNIREHEDDLYFVPKSGGTLSMNAELQHGEPPLAAALELPTAPVQRAGAELSIVVPTFNERDNVVELVLRVTRALGDSSWELVFVDDDSPDGTADLVRELAGKNSRVRCLQRIDRRGLSSACVEGMLSSSAAFLAVIDGDLQHDEQLLPRMLEILKHEDIDIVVGSRYIPGGDISEWDEKRARMSRIAARFSRVLVPPDLRDPMSGFFMMRRCVLQATAHDLSAVGFKILADLFASSKTKLRFRELPYQFKNRHAGTSKLDSGTAWDYLMLLLDKMTGRVVPVRFVAFCIVGALGVGVHFAALTVITGFLGATFIEGQAAALVCAMTFNFAVNNVLTYRDRRLHGWRWLRGWFSFVLACSVGGLANLGVAKALYDMNQRWAMAALTGVLVGAVWNYAITTLLTWRRPRGAAPRLKQN